MIRFLFVSLFRWAWFPVSVAIASSTALSFVPGAWGLLASLLGLLAIGIWVVVLLISAIRALVQRNGKRAAALPIVLLGSLPLILLGARSGDYVHLAALYPYYISKIHEQPDWNAKDIQFAWGDGAVSVLDGMQLNVLVYDATGKTVVGDGPGPEAGVRSKVRHLIGNFYLLHVYTG